MKHFGLASFAALLACAVAPFARAQDNVDPLLRGDASKIILVGDSTVAVGSGWGSRFCSDHVTYELTCVNLARNGRSTASYRREGSWSRALSEARCAGYRRVWILIQFGHNDQPGKPGHSTDLRSEFPANLERYVREAREAGAIPVLVTPLTRRIFREGVVDNTLAPWADSMRQVAAKLGVPLIDLNGRSVALVQALGPLLADRFAQAPPTPELVEAALGDQTPPPGRQSVATPLTTKTPPTPSMARPRVEFDYTHLGAEGAAFFATVMTRELARDIPEMRPLLVLP